MSSLLKNNLYKNQLKSMKIIVLCLTLQLSEMDLEQYYFSLQYTNEIPLMHFPQFAHNYILFSPFKILSLQLINFFSQLNNPLLELLQFFPFHRYKLYTQISNIKITFSQYFLMLNPFAIEKEFLAKTTKLKSMLTSLKKIVAASVLKKSETTFIDPKLLCKCLILSDLQNGKQYLCRVCGKLFDEGRKLGGHVSRAHKGSQVSIPSEQDSYSIPPIRFTTRRTRRFMKYDDAQDSETGIKKVKIEEEIYEPEN